MSHTFIRLLLPVILICSFEAWSITQLDTSAPVDISTQLPKLGGSSKAKIESTDNGLLIAVYLDYVENDPQHYVFDLKSASERPAQDVFVTVCDRLSGDCSDLSNWSLPVNLSATAQMSSIATDWNADGLRTDYHGDSDNPHMFSSGDHVVISWGDKYCPGGDQRTTTYLEFNSREIAMSCLYVAHASNSFSQISDWTVDRLSDGSRDVKQDNNKGTSSGSWAVVWQEDPMGLQPGEAEGPGEGASGAKVSHGTDIWYSYSSNITSAISDIGVWTTPVRITDNQTGFGLHGSFNPIRNALGSSVDPAQIETGIAGASRANLQVVGGSSPPTTLLAYEETKGSGGLAEGKFLRYHAFPFNSPPATIQEKAGCIVSDPAENARRARFVAQSGAAPGTGLRLALFWRQGLYDQGGPADIMLRLGKRSTEAGSTGLLPADLSPAVDASCATSDYSTAIALNNAAALNISTATPTATETNLADDSDVNSIENARAHRAVLRGNDLYVGYLYTADGVVAAATDLANYNFFVRHFNAGSGIWQSPINLSEISNTAINALEPRLMGTPGNGPGCADPGNITNPEDCQNKSVLIAAWGTESNVYDHIGGAENLDIYLTRTTDRGEHWEPITYLASGPSNQGAAQLRVTPDGNHVAAVWTEANDSGSNTMYSEGRPVTLYSDMSLTLSQAPAGVEIGASFEIEYGVENLGPERAYGIELVVNLPASVQHLSSPDKCVYDTGVLTCSLGDMNPGSGQNLRIKLQPSTIEQFEIEASITGDLLDDPDLGNNELQLVFNAPPSSDISLAAMSDISSIDVDDVITLHYLVTNNGPSAAESVELIKVLPPGVSLVQSSPDICVNSTNRVICDIGIVELAGKFGIAITLRVDRAGELNLQALAVSDTFDPDISNNQTGTSLQVNPVIVEIAQEESDNQSRLEEVFGCASGNPRISRSIYDPTLLSLLLFAFYRFSRSHFFHRSAKQRRQEYENSTL